MPRIMGIAKENAMTAKLKTVKSPSVRERVTKEEWQVRVDLAAAYQLAAQFRWTDLIYTHFSARVPGTEDILINAYGLMFDEITASNLVKIDLAGNILDDPLEYGINQAGYVIHSCVHKARPEINCVIHTHTRAGAAVSAMKCGLLPVSQHAMRVHAELTYHDYEGIALEMDEQTRLARDLGKTSKAMILRNHGLLALGETVREAFEVMYYLDCSCQIQIDAMAGGMDNVLLMSERAARTADEQFHRGDRPAEHKDWPALLRMLERRGIDYRR
jgi:ribulose-5-phosphate 4-epimerase/fuculose-1-phosphate aldolase